MTEIEKLQKRVQELEEEVVRLKATQHVIHSHYHYTSPGYYTPPMPPVFPFNPLYPQVTWDAGANTAGNAV